MPVRTAGRVGCVNENLAIGESMAARPSSRYPGLKAISNASPSTLHSTASLAWASSPAPARSTTSEPSKFRRTGVLRSATSDTRFTASASMAVSTRATDAASFGSRVRYFGNSPSRSRVVVRRPLPSNPMRPSPAPGGARAMLMTSADAKAFAASASVRAGMSACALILVDDGFHWKSRTANRYLSVAASTRLVPSISRRMPVNVGSVSSRPAAMATWATAVAKREPAISPDETGISGSWG